MIESLVKSAEDAVDSVLAKYVSWLAVGVLLLIAGGFATAAIAIKLVEAYGALNACLIIASVLAIIAMLAGAYTHYRLNLVTQASAAAAEEPAEPSVADEVAATMNQLNPELIVAALTSLGPTALPILLRAAVRNLPLLLALAAGVYVVALFNRGPAEVPVTAGAGGPQSDVTADAA